MRKKYFVILICFLAICGISIFATKSFSQEEAPDPPPEELSDELPEGLSEELIKEMLDDEELPPEIRRELAGMLRKGEFEEEAPEIPPEEEEYPPVIEEEEIEELERPPERPRERPRIRRPKSEIKILPSTRPSRISLDLKGVDIIDVLKMLSARSDINIVAGRNVRGRVTLFLKDVDVWDAFEIILAANSLAYVKEGEIINVMTERDYEALYGEKYYTKQVLRIYKLEYAKASDVSKVLNQAKSKIGKIIIDEGTNTIVLVDSLKAIPKMEKMMAELDMPIETKVFSLDYARAEDIKAKISEILTKPIGTMQVDERTNKLVITDLSKKMPEIATIIEEMDEKHKEVLIETKIVQIALDDEYQYGIDWKMVFEELGEQRLDFNFDTLGDFVSGTGDAYATGGALTLAKVASRNISGVVEALQTMGRTNVLSCPRITVLNNEEAKVLVGTNQPYITETTIAPDTGSTYTSEAITYVDVGVELVVTPTINNEGYVTMKIKPKISSVTSTLGTTGARDAIPVVSTSETETTVMVKDGTTIIIAGLIEDRDEVSESKIPFLGDIPIIGNLFKNKTLGSSTLPEKKELVIFLTPYIVHGNETFPEAENVWFGDTITQRELLEQQMSLAVEDIKRKRSLVREIPPPPEVEDKTTRISEDLGWFKRREAIEEPEERKAKRRKKVKPVKKRGIVPEKVVTRGEPEKRAIVLPPSLITPTTSGYYGYLENVRNRIYWVAKNTYPTRFNGKEDVRVLFTLTKDGRLKGEPKILNGVAKELKKAAKSAVKNAAPFLPFPKRMDKKEEIFKITITYQ